MGNHPNSFMDPLILATLFRQRLGFLANASIFVNAIVNAIFRFFQLIPVYREKDVAPGTKIDNEHTFRECYKFLENNNSLMLFPEGSSYHELKLRKIKTGGARIALGVESKNDFELGLTIIPIGLYYSNPSKFRSKIYVNVGTPIMVKDFQTAHQTDAVLAVQSLTKRIKQSLESLTITTSDKEQEDLFFKIKRIYKNHLVKNFSDPKNKHEEFRLTQEIANAIQYFKLNFESKYEYLKANIERCNYLLDEFKTSSEKVIPLQSQVKKKIIDFSGGLYLLLGFPIFLYGLIQNYLPYLFPLWLAKKFTDEPEYYAPMMMSLGMFVFPGYYFLSSWGFNHWTEPSSIGLSIYVISLPLSGYFALHYASFAKRAQSFLKIHKSNRQKDHLLTELATLQQDITEELDLARANYLKRL